MIVSIVNTEGEITMEYIRNTWEEIEEEINNKWGLEEDTLELLNELTKDTDREHKGEANEQN